MKLPAYKAGLPRFIGGIKKNNFINDNAVGIPLFGKDPLLRPEARGPGSHFFVFTKKTGGQGRFFKILFVKSPLIPLGTSLLGFSKGGKLKGELFTPVYKTGYSSSFLHK